MPRLQSLAHVPRRAAPAAVRSAPLAIRAAPPRSPLPKAGCSCGGFCPACRAEALAGPDHPAEREADAVAARVMAMPDPSPLSVAEPETLRRQPEEEQLQMQAEEEEEEDETLQLQPEEEKEKEEVLVQPKAEASAAVPAAPAGPPLSGLGAGRPMPTLLRAFFEPRFGRSFANVRLHDDAAAHALAKSFRAQAFTYGRNIVFGAGRFRPDAHMGRHLIAHELAHVVQQQTALPRSTLMDPAGPPGAPASATKAPRVLPQIATNVGGNMVQRATCLQVYGAPGTTETTSLVTDRESVKTRVRTNLNSWTPHLLRRLDQEIGVGRAVVFGAGQYAPRTMTGRRLLAHELTHIVQQRFSGIDRIQRQPQGPQAASGPGYVRHPHGGVMWVPDMAEWYRSTRPQSGFKPGEAVGELVKTVVAGGVEYVVDLGRGVLHIGRYGKATVVAIWDPSELKSLTNNDIAFIGLIYRIVTNPEKVLETIIIGYTAALAAERELSEEQKQKQKQLAKEAASEFGQKKLGKWLVKKALITALVGPLMRRIEARVSSELAKKVVSKAKGAPLLALSVLGLMEKAGEASKGLKKRYPLLYYHLEREGLHMAWFLIEPHEAELRRQVEAELGRRGYIGPVRGEMVKLTYSNGLVERRRVVRICTDGVLHFDPPGQAHMSAFKSIAFDGGTLRPVGSTAADRERFFKAVGKQPEAC